jgi:hypothetical protein
VVKIKNYMRNGLAQKQKSVYKTELGQKKYYLLNHEQVDVLPAPRLFPHCGFCTRQDLPSSALGDGPGMVRVPDSRGDSALRRGALYYILLAHSAWH